MPGAFPPSLVPYARATLPLQNSIYVNKMTGVSGSGTSGDPWVGAPAAIGNGIAYTQYIFPKGDYDNGVDSIAITATDVALVGEAGTRIIYKGTDKAIIFDGRKRGTITVAGATGGTFTLKVRVGGKGASQTTTTLSNVATNAQVVAALNALSNVGGGTTATGGPLGTSPVVVNFVSSLGLVAMTIGTNSLTGGGTVTVTSNLGDFTAQMEEIYVRDLIIDCNKTAERGIYMDFIWGGETRNVKVRRLAQTTTSAAFDYQFFLNHTLYNLMHSIFFDAGADPSGMAYYGLILGSTTIEDVTYPPADCNCPIINCNFDAVRNYAIWFQNGFAGPVIGGAMTSLGTACRIENKCDDLIFIGTDFENGATQLGVYCDAVRCFFIQCISNSGITLTANAGFCLFHGGKWGATGTVTNNGFSNQFIGVSGITIAGITGTGASEVFEYPGGTHQVPSLNIKDSAISPKLSIESTDTSSSSAALVSLKAKRSNVSQEYFHGLGQGTDDYIVYDNTNAKYLLRIQKNTGNATFLGSLTVTGTFIPSGGFGSSLAVSAGPGLTALMDIFANDTGYVSGSHAIAMLQLRSNQSGHNITWQLATNIDNNTALTLWNGTDIVWQARENSTLILGASGKSVGFFGSTGTTKPTLAAAATDAASTQTLANSIRTALINLSLCS